MNYRIVSLFVLCLCQLIWVGCSLQKLTADATKGAVNAFKPEARPLADSLMKGLTDRLARALHDSLGSNLNQEIAKAIRVASASADSAVIRLGGTANLQAKALRDSLLSQTLTKQLNHLIENTLGSKTEGRLVSIVRSVVKELPNDRYLAGMVHQALTQLAADSSQLQRLEKSLLGPDVSRGLQVVIDSAMNTLVRRYNQDLSPAIRGEVGFIQRYANQLIYGLGGLILLIIAFVWWQRRSYLKEIETLKGQLVSTQVPDHETLTDLVVKRLTSDEHKDKLEPLLQQALRLQNRT
ncbi:MAG: hypothetical protein U0Y10_19850 [Spirosomataceae bacterium]